MSSVIGDASRGIREDDFYFIMDRTQWRKLGQNISDSHGSTRVQTERIEGGFTAIFVDNIPCLWAPGCPAQTVWGVQRSAIKYRTLIGFEVEQLGRTKDEEEAYIKHYSNAKNEAPQKCSKIHNLAA